MYVRLRIADTHRRPISRSLVVWFHAAVLLLVALAAVVGWVPWLTLLPFVVYLGRGVWAAAGERPIANIKRFGFSEVGVEIAGGILIAVAWLI